MRGGWVGSNAWDKVPNKYGFFLTPSLRGKGDPSFADMHCAATNMQGGRLSQKKSHKIGTSPPPLGAKSWQLTKKGWIGWECRISARWGRSGPTQPDSICQNFELVPDRSHTTNPLGGMAAFFMCHEREWKSLIHLQGRSVGCMVSWLGCCLVGWICALCADFAIMVRHELAWLIVSWLGDVREFSAGQLVCWFVGKWLGLLPW